MICLWSCLGLCESVGGRVWLCSYCSIFVRVPWSTRVGVCTFSTGCHCCCWVFAKLQCLCECLCVCMCVLKLLFNFYFLFYSWPNPNATQLCSQPEKEGLGDGLPGPGECSHALQLLPTDGREMGLPAWAYPLFVGQTDPHPPHIYLNAHTHIWTYSPNPSFGHNTKLKSLHFGVNFFFLFATVLWYVVSETTDPCLGMSELSDHFYQKI